MKFSGQQLASDLISCAVVGQLGGKDFFCLIAKVGRIMVNSMYI